jgi:hypothetical protein
VLKECLTLPTLLEMGIHRQLLLPGDLRPAAGQTEDKDVTLHGCGVMKYTRSLGQSRIPDNVLRGRARTTRPRFRRQHRVVLQNQADAHASASGAGLQPNQSPLHFIVLSWKPQQVSQGVERFLKERLRD